MNTPVKTLLESQLRRWFSAKGFALVMAATLLPVVLTAAWAGTHQSDLTAESLQWTPEDPAPGDLVNFTAEVKNTGDRAVGAFNATLTVGRVSGNVLVARPDGATNLTRVDGLEPGETAAVRVTWPARAGAFVALLNVDPEDAIGEVEEFNNQKIVPITVNIPDPDPDNAPQAQGNLTGNQTANATADLAITLGDIPTDVAPGENATLTATVTNNGPDAIEDATATLRIVQRRGGGPVVPMATETLEVSLAPGASETVELTWTARQGAFWVQAYVDPGDGAIDPTGDDNHATEPLVVQPTPLTEEDFPAAPERTTLKLFYRTILEVVELRILLPLIALFYAGGVLTDEREAGTLPYLLTRPVPRWLLPITKFVAGYLVAAVAVILGILATFALLFGFSGDVDAGLITAPLALSLLTLFAYGGFFILLGVLVDRPYLVGAAFIIGWEAIVGFFVPWVENLTISHHVGNLIDAWWDADALQFVPFPEGAEAARALAVVVGAGVAFLALAAVAMKQREFAA